MQYNLHLCVHRNLTWDSLISAVESSLIFVLSLEFEIYGHVQISAHFRKAFISDHKFSFYNPRLLEQASNKTVLIKEYSDPN